MFGVGVRNWQQHRSFANVTVTAAMVKTLRERSGAPMMDCKKALSADEVNGDIDKAIDWLRAKGIARASNTTARVASEGLIALYANPSNNKLTLLEVNSETDFVARNQEFQAFVSEVARSVNALPKVGDVTTDEILQAKPVGSALPNLRESLGDAVGKIRETIILRRAVNIVPKEETVVGTYVHGKVGSGQSLTSSLLTRRCV